VHVSSDSHQTRHIGQGNVAPARTQALSTRMGNGAQAS